MSALRMLFLTLAALILLGIWLTGFNTVHWLRWCSPASPESAPATCSTTRSVSGGRCPETRFSQGTRVKLRPGPARPEAG